ncbi:hypothetical protein NW767_006754 [Fusarium falciforme]|nr:hypothetical protein NW767_006754 [Fusarium falciforme]
MSEGILDVLYEPECNFMVQEDGRGPFNALHRILVNHTTAADGIDISQTPEAAIAKITSEKSIVDDIIRLCNQVSVKRGLFASHKDHFASGPAQMADGYIIRIFEGVSAPIALRKQGDLGRAHWVLGPVG